MKGKPDKKKLKILAISDFHGRFPKILNEDKDFDMIISPGDYCESSKIRSIIFKNWEHRREWYDIVGRKKARNLLMDSVRTGTKVVKKLCGFGKPVYGIPGNSDYTGGEDAEWVMHQKNFYKKYTNLPEFKDVDLKRRIIKKNGVEFQIIGYGECSYPEKQADPEMYKYYLGRLDRIFRKRKKRVPVLFLSHDVPYGVLDKVGMKASPKYGEHMGSEVVATIVKRFKPSLCVAGHMHETQGRRKSGRTIVVNCGFGHKGQYAVIETDGKKVKLKLRGKGRKK